VVVVEPKVGLHLELAVQGVAELEQILVATILELQTLAVEVVVLGLQLVAQVVLE
jgi:hypothetical protein